jgi:anti-sigma B factor antagonist
VIGLEVEQVDGVAVARYRGDIDAANASRLRDALIELLGRTTDNLVLDLSTTPYLDSAGIDMLFRLNERLRQRRARLHAVIPPDSQLVRVAEIVALPSVIAVHDSVADALAVCADARAAHECGSG